MAQDLTYDIEIWCNIAMGQFSHGIPCCDTRLAGKLAGKLMDVHPHRYGIELVMSQPHILSWWKKRWTRKYPLGSFIKRDWMGNRRTKSKLACIIRENHRTNWVGSSDTWGQQRVLLISPTIFPLYNHIQPLLVKICIFEDILATAFLISNRME